MGKKFIPNGDGDFRALASAFAAVVNNAPAGGPGRVGVSDDDAAALAAAVDGFRAAYLVARQNGSKSPVTTAEKEARRVAAEKVVRRLAAMMRANPAIGDADRVMLGLRERSARPVVRGVPGEPPVLAFVRAIHESGYVPEHELTFGAQDGKTRPAGAARLELFADLIPPDADVRSHYESDAASRPIYLRSYTRSPVRLVPPMATVPMRVVYWARWADTSGEVGSFGKPAAGWVEGGSHHLMTMMPMGRQTPVVVVDVSPAARQREATLVVAVLNGDAARPLRRLEGPAAEAA